MPVFTADCVGLLPSAGSKRTLCVAWLSVSLLLNGLVEGEPVLSCVPVGVDEVFGLAVGFNGAVACIGDGVGSGVLIALLGRVAGVCLATRGV